jgi:uncharacterized protein YlxP (DUF503 family)
VRDWSYAATMFVGVCRLTLMLPESGSLKDKRAVLRRIKDRVQLKFNVAIAEVGDQDLWQSAQLGMAVVSNDRAFSESMIAKIVDFIEQLGAAKIVDDEKDVVDYGEGELDAGTWQHWETDQPSPMARPAPGRGKLKIPVRGSRR